MSEAKGWQDFLSMAYVAMPFVLLAEFVMDIAELGSQGRLSVLADNIDVIWMLSIIVSVSAVVAMLVKTHEQRAFRWVIFGLSLLMVGSVLQHQLGHVAEYLSEGINLHLPFDLAFDILGIWTTVVAWKWARLRE